MLQNKRHGSEYTYKNIAKNKQKQNAKNKQKQNAKNHSRIKLFLMYKLKAFKNKIILGTLVLW